MKSTYRIGTYIIWSVNFSLLKVGIISETLELPNFFWELAWEETWHVQFFPLQHRRLAWLSFWHHPASLSWYRNVMGQGITQRRRKGYWVDHFLELVMHGSKPGLFSTSKNIRKPEAISFLFVLIFYTFSAGHFYRAFCQTKLSSEVTLVLLWRAQWSQRWKWIYLGLRDAVKAANFIMTYITYIILSHHVSPLQLNRHWCVLKKVPMLRSQL